jgi:hypothetical protein
MDPYAFLTVMTEKPPEKRYRKNLDTYLVPKCFKK